MSFTFDKYKELSNLIDKNYDDDNAFTIVMEALEEFINKYKDSNIHDLPENYRMDTKIMFMMIKKFMLMLKF